jgi:predicted nucleic acid-binding Zn ribbon protein
MLKNNNQRAKNIITIFSILFVLNVISIISDLLQYSMLNSIEGFSLEEAELNDSRQRIISIITFGIYILCYIFFILWFRRAYYNLHQVVKHLEHTEGWAAGAWFVPILNLFRPYQIMRELYIETENYICKVKSDYKKKLNVTFVGIWWTLWIIASFLERIGMRLNMDAETLEEITRATKINLANEFFTIPLCLIIIKVIKDYNNVERELFEIEKNKNLEVTDNPNEVITTTE